MTERRSKRETPATFTIEGALTFANPLLREFSERHRGWLDRHATNSPAYLLPSPVIADQSGQFRRRQPAILQEADAEIETDFAALCGRLNAIGIWQSRPVLFPYLGEQPPLPTREEMLSRGWSNAQVLAAQAAADRAADATLRLKGYVGWLVIDPQFLSERDNLKTFWGNLRPTERPSFPLQRAVPLTSPPGGRQASREVSQFQTALAAFLDRRGLMQLASWDLPQPQGPLIPASFPANAPAMPRHGLHIVLPIHYPLTGTDGLLQRIREQQVELARQNNLDPSLAGLGRYEVFAQMLEVEHIERAIRSRYGRPGQRGGFVTALEFAIAAALGVRIDHVKRLRKGIAACKRGRRSSIRWLRPAAGSGG